MATVTGALVVDGSPHRRAQQRLHHPASLKADDMAWLPLSIERTAMLKRAVPLALYEAPLEERLGGDCQAAVHPMSRCPP